MKDPVKIMQVTRTKTLEPTTTTPPPSDVRERTVKRYTAACLFEGCEFPARKDVRAHLSRAGAEVEGLRHLREMHPFALAQERSAKRTVEVQRRVVGEELLPE